MAEYSVAEAFQQIEDYLIDSMIRNLSHHVGLEQAEGINYTQWQAEQLAALAEYRRTNAEKFTEYFSKINARITVALNRAAQLGETEQEQAILKALQSGWKRPRPAKDYGTDNLSGAFFRVNDRKLNAYIAAVKRDMKKAETALLRMADDQYRKAIFNAGVAYNTGIYTLPQAIDSATKDMLSRGLNCIEYKNGARVCIDTYAEMALRTSATRCYLQGESRKRDEWGVNTVIVNKRGIACPKCLKYVGRVFYDDVYGSVPVPDDKYPRLSEAIAGGLYHPNCKDIHTTWFEGISTPPAEMSDAEKKKAEENYKLEQRQRYNERQIRKYKRLSAGTLDPDEKQRYTKRLVQWENYNANFIEQHGDVLRQRAEREKIRDWNFSVPKPPIKTRKGVDKSAGSGIIESTDGVEDFFDRKVSKTDFSEDLKKVNPNWNTREPEWQNNCQRCVPAYEIRRRGFEVTAKPREYSIQNGKKVLKDDPITKDCFSVWDNVALLRFKSKTDIENRMDEWGDGARAQIRVTFNNGTGHTFIAERIDGKVYFVDPQTGNTDCSNYFDIILDTRSNLFARIDKATLKEACIEMCCARERR